MKDGAKEILLKVADEIEADENYTGHGWWDNKHKKGCAMARITVAGGAELIFLDDENEAPYFKLKGFKNIFDNEDGPFSMLYVDEASSFITDIDGSFWDTNFRDFSIEADRFETAKVLRMLANEQFDFDESIHQNLEHIKL